jgi:hypothetical protein
MTKKGNMQAHDLLKLAEALSRHRNWSLSTVALYAANDGKFFKRIAESGGCTLRTAQRVVGWFAANWPDDLSWPVDIPRPHPPKPKKEAA